MGTGDPAATPGAGVDVFVSYTGADEAWALWVAAVLEAEGQRVRVQAWDSPAGTNFVGWINEQMTLAARTVAICSATYFASHWCTQEWTGALAGNTLTPLRVADCAIPPVLATIAYRDLHGVDETTARRRLVEAVGLAVPARVSSGFPGGPAPALVGALFPGGRPRRGGTPAALADPRPAGAVRVIDADPYRLGVHRAIHLDGAGDDTLPAYVDRDIDHTPAGIRARLRAAAAGRGGFVLLVGGSSVGKTRCALEAVRVELPDWWLIHPTDSAQITALAAAPPARTVLWLDEIQTYLQGEHGLTAGTVQTLLDAGLVLVGTIWPDRHRTYTTPPDTDADPYGRERGTLRLAAVIDVDSEFTAAERTRARAAAAEDPRIRTGLDSPDDGLTQTLAAAPALLRHWITAKTETPYAWAVITAALDAARLGIRSPLLADLLRAAATGYCTPRQQATAPTRWFEQALAYATEELHGAAAALTPISNGQGMGPTVGYTAADYLLQHATSTRRYERPPASLWTALHDHPTRPDDLARLTDNALDYQVYALAVPLLRQAIDAGDPYAARRLSGLLVEAGDHEELRRLADTGDQYAARRLAETEEQQAAIELLRRRAGTGNLDAAIQLAGLLLKAGDRTSAIELLRPHADAGEGEGDDWGELLLPHADAAAHRLSNLLVEAGDHEELRRRADSGDPHAAIQLAGLLLKAGDRTSAIELLRPHADAGEYAIETAKLLAEVGDREELRRHADAGNRSAAFHLFRLLAKAGDHEELRRHADAGDWAAVSHLAGLLAAAGDDRLRRYGFDVHGQIANGPTW